jgi:two-component system sensor histidine kinase CpxA
VLQVADRGPGVPEASLESIFRPFYRLDFSRQRATGGYGVGLAIADRAVRLHGGEVTAKNRPGGGLTVELRLNMTCREPNPEAASIAAESAKD